MEREVAYDGEEKRTIYKPKWIVGEELVSLFAEICKGYLNLLTILRWPHCEGGLLSGNCKKQ